MELAEVDKVDEIVVEALELNVEVIELVAEEEMVLLRVLETEVVKVLDKVVLSVVLCELDNVDEIVVLTELDAVVV